MQRYQEIHHSYNERRNQPKCLNWLFRRVNETVIPEPANEIQAAKDSQIDHAVLAEWQAMLGEGYPEFLSRMVSRFVEDASRCVEDLQRAVENGDMAQLAEVAHGLKGISSNMGVMHLAELAFELEQRGRNQVKDQNEGLCQQLQQVFQQVHEEFNKEIEKPSSN